MQTWQNGTGRGGLQHVPLFTTPGERAGRGEGDRRLGTVKETGVWGRKLVLG